MCGYCVPIYCFFSKWSESECRVISASIYKCDLSSSSFYLGFYARGMRVVGFHDRACAAMGPDHYEGWIA